MIGTDIVGVEQIVIIRKSEPIIYNFFFIYKMDLKSFEDVCNVHVGQEFWFSPLTP